MTLKKSYDTFLECLRWFAGSHKASEWRARVGFQLGNLQIAKYLIVYL
jgi:hypothetical protein